MIVDELVSVLGLEIRDTGLTQFRSNIQATIGKLGLLGAGAIAAASAITALAVNSASDTSASAKFARAVGLSAQELQRMEFAAKRMGISTGALRGFLSDVTTQLAQFRTGGADKLFEAFAQIGVNPLENGKPKEALELLMQLADAAGNASTEVAALGVAAQIGLGAEFFPFLKLGRDGIAALAAEANTLPDHVVRGLENLDGKMQQLKNAGSVALAEFGAPVVEELTKALEALLTYARSDGFASLKSDIIGIVAGLIAATKEAANFYAEISKGLPEGSTAAALALGIGAVAAKRHPVAATGTAALLIGGDARKGFRGEDTYSTEALPQLARLLDAASNFLDAYLYNPVRDAVGKGPIKPLGLEEDVRRLQHSIGFGAPISIENLSITVPTVKNATDLRDALNNDSTIRDAAERGTGSAR